MELTEIDSFDQLSEREVTNNQLVDAELFESYNESIKQQYIELENLGVNLINDIDDNQIKDYILSEFIQYVHNNITPLTQFYTNENNYKLKKNVYSFICVDCYSTITPGFLESIKVFDYNSFESYYNNTLQNNASYFKARFVKSIQNIKNNIDKLKTLDNNIKNDKNYQDLLNKYNFYVQLMNFGDIENFLENYFKPMLSKNENDIIWRIS